VLDHRVEDRALEPVEHRPGEERDLDLAAGAVRRAVELEQRVRAEGRALVLEPAAGEVGVAQDLVHLGIGGDPHHVRDEARRAHDAPLMKSRS
jgi:hypothetical protein